MNEFRKYLTILESVDQKQTIKVDSLLPNDIFKVLKDGNKAWVPGGFHTKSELIKLRDHLSQELGKTVKISYSGEHTHRYYFYVID